MSSGRIDEAIDNLIFSPGQNYCHTMVSLLMDCHVTIKVVRTFKGLVTTAAQKRFLMCAPLGINIFENTKEEIQYTLSQFGH